MSFISDIENFFGGIFRPVTNIVSGAVSTVSSIPTDLENFGKTVTKIFGGFVNFLSQIPSDIMNIITGLGGSIMTGLQLLGSWLQSGLSAIGSGFVGAFNTIAGAIGPFFDTLVQALTIGVSFIADNIEGFVNFITTGITNAWQWLQEFTKTIGEIIQGSLTVVADFFIYTPQLFNDFLQMLTDNIAYIEQNVSNLLDAPQQIYQHYTDSVPFNILKQEASRIATGMDQILGYNIFMEVTKNTIKRSWLSQNLKWWERALYIIGAPLVGAFAGQVSSIILNSFFKNAKTTTISHYKPLTISTATTKVHSSYTKIPTFSVPQIQHNTIGPPLPPSITPPSRIISKKPHIMSILIYDLIKLPGIIARTGVYTVGSLIQFLQDTLNMNLSLALQIAQYVSATITDVIQPNIYTESVSATSQLVNTLVANIDVSYSVLSIPLGAKLCKMYPPLTTQSYLAGYSEDTIDQLDVLYQICISPVNIKVDYLEVNLAITTPKPNVGPDIATIKLKITTPTPNAGPDTLILNLSITTPTPNVGPDTLIVKMSITSPTPNVGPDTLIVKMGVTTPTPNIGPDTIKIELGTTSLIQNATNCFSRYTGVTTVTTCTVSYEDGLVTTLSFAFCEKTGSSGTSHCASF